MSSHFDAESDCLEYLLGLACLGLSGKAFGIYGRCLAREVRPVLLKQKALLERAIRGAAVDESTVKQLDAELAAAWGRCLEQLKTLWLTEGPHEEEAA